MPDHRSFPTTATGIGQAIAWMKRTTNGNVLAAIEGKLFLRRRPEPCPEDGRYPRGRGEAAGQAGRTGVGKSDPSDAVEAARQALHRDVKRLAEPRADGRRLLPNDSDGRICTILPVAGSRALRPLRE